MFSSVKTFFGFFYPGVKTLDLSAVNGCWTAPQKQKRLSNDFCCGASVASVAAVHNLNIKERYLNIKER